MNIFDNATFFQNNMFGYDQLNGYTITSFATTLQGTRKSTYDNNGRIMRQTLMKSDSNWITYHYNNDNVVDSIQFFLKNWNGYPMYSLGYEYANGLEIKRTRIDYSLSKSYVDSMVYANGRVIELWKKQKDNSQPNYGNFVKYLISYDNNFIDYVETQNYSSSQNAYVGVLHEDYLNNGSEIIRINEYGMSNGVIDSNSLFYFSRITYGNSGISKFEKLTSQDTINPYEKIDFQYYSPGFLAKINHVYDGNIGGPYYQNNITEFGYSSIVNIEELDPNELAIFPNPTKNILNVQTKEPIDYIEIYDNSGRLILKESISKVNFDIDVSNLPNGSYLLVLPYKTVPKVARFSKE